MASVRLALCLSLLTALAACPAANPDDNASPDASVHPDAGTPDAPPRKCGNGHVDIGEACDPALPATGECADNGYEPGPAPCNASCQWDYNQCTPIPNPCGNGTLDSGEACDDGNANSNDGCSASCQLETGCTCSGTPSSCSCTTTSLIATTTESIDTGALALDASGQAHVTYFYAVNFTDPVTNYSREHAHTVYASRPSSSWSTYDIDAWDQTQTVIGPESFQLAYDGGALHAFYHRIYDADGTFAAGTFTSSTWQTDYANPYYIYDTVRGGCDWHAIVRAQQFGDLRYYMGAPGAWTRDESLTSANLDQSYAMRIVAASNGDVYVASMSPTSGHGSYHMKLSKRIAASTWSTVYDVATSGTCVYPVMHQPLALGNGEVMTFEDGFNGSGQRWLRAHRLVGSSWVVEDVANLSWLPYSSCSSGGASWRTLRTVAAADAQGRPHILFPSQPTTTNGPTPSLEDHYRDAAGWHVRTYTLANGTPLAMVIDAAGTTHLLVLAPSSSPSTTRILYIRIAPSGWQ